jgi:hypothetical protein
MYVEAVTVSIRRPDVVSSYIEGRAKTRRSLATPPGALLARRAILPSLIDLLRKDLPFTWFKATDLFDKSTHPVGFNNTSFLKAIFHETFESYREATTTYPEAHGEIEWR